MPSTKTYEPQALISMTSTSTGRSPQRATKTTTHCSTRRATTSNKTTAIASPRHARGRGVYDLPVGLRSLRRDVRVATAAGDHVLENMPRPKVSPRQDLSREPEGGEPEDDGKPPAKSVTGEA